MTCMETFLAPTALQLADAARKEYYTQRFQLFLLITAWCLVNGRDELADRWIEPSLPLIPISRGLSLLGAPFGVPWLWSDALQEIYKDGLLHIIGISNKPSGDTPASTEHAQLSFALQGVHV